MNSGIKCDHDSSQVLYVCTCNQLLCQKCVASHENLHLSRNERPEIRDINVVRDETVQKIQKYLGNLDVQRKNITQYKQDIFESKQFTEGFELLHKAQNEIRKLVNAFFKVLESDFSEKCRLVKEEYESNLDQAEKKLTYMFETFRDLLLGISKKPGVWQKSLEVALNFDFRTEVNKINSEVEQAVKEKFYINMLPKYLDTILQELHNYIQINSEEFKLNSSHVSHGEILADLKKLEMNSVRELNLKTSVLAEDLFISTGQHKNVSYLDLVEFDVKQPNFFHEDCPNKLLHFFEANTKNLYVVPLQELESNSPQCHKIELNIKTNIPARHRSVITPFGDIFLTGGSRGPEILAYTYKLNFLNGALLPKRLMASPRKSHGFCYMDNHLYAIGGYNEEFGALPLCERYSIAHDKWIPIAQMNYRTSSPSVCTFKNRYIFKFGGLLGTAQVNDQIEKYDSQTNKWTVYQIKNSADELKKMDFKIFWLSASCQINDNHIVVFGGCDENNQGTKQSFILEVNEMEGPNAGSCSIKKRNALMLPYAAGFWNGQCVIQNGKMFALQNELREDDPSIAYESNRNLLILDSATWKMFKV